MGLALLTAPTQELLKREEVKLQLRIDEDDENDLLDAWNTVCREFCEEDLRRQFVQATYQLTLDRFPRAYESDFLPGNGWFLNGEICLPRPPLKSVTEIRYIDPDGTPQTLASSNYEVVTDREPGRIRLAYDKTWPAVRQHKGVISIDFVAGYGTRDEVPERVKGVVKLLIAHVYNHRDAFDGTRRTITHLPTFWDRLTAQLRVKAIC